MRAAGAPTVFYYLKCALLLLDAARASWLLLQVFMTLFGLVSIAFAIYGMASLKKDVTTEAFGILGTVSNYTVNATDALNRLMSTLGGVNAVIDNFQDISATDIELESLQRNLTVRCESVLRNNTALGHPI
jgi:hypothetical protein